MKKHIKGIIFDMDNTILQSRIDFVSMKQETLKFLISRRILADQVDFTNHTSSIIIAEALKTGLMNDEMIKEMWEVPKRFEVMGMENARLEPGAAQLLHELHGQYTMVIVTNNAVEAAEYALQDNNIREYFDCVVGRDMMDSLKPSPDGFLYVLNKYKHIPAQEWISIGDSWIDGKAATSVGIDFISYRADREKMNRNGVLPKAEIHDLKEFTDLITCT